jgi:ferredoxin
VKVVADVLKCQGHGRCYDLAPNVFDSDDEGRVSLLIAGDIADGRLEQEARSAVDNCPEHALELAN